MRRHIASFHSSSNESFLPLTERNLIAEKRAERTWQLVLLRSFQGLSLPHAQIMFSVQHD